MPRVEIIPAGWETSKDKADGNGTPTIDVCKACSENFVEGEPLKDAAPASGYDDATIGSTDVDHPSFVEDVYHCELCDDKLTDDDD